MAAVVFGTAENWAVVQVAVLGMVSDEVTMVGVARYAMLVILRAATASLRMSIWVGLVERVEHVGIVDVDCLRDEVDTSGDSGHSVMTPASSSDDS